MSKWVSDRLIDWKCMSNHLLLLLLLSKSVFIVWLLPELLLPTTFIASNEKLLPTTCKWVREWVNQWSSDRERRLKSDTFISIVSSLSRDAIGTKVCPSILLRCHNLKFSSNSSRFNLAFKPMEIDGKWVSEWVSMRILNAQQRVASVYYSFFWPIFLDSFWRSR